MPNDGRRGPGSAFRPLSRSAKRRARGLRECLQIESLEERTVLDGPGLPSPTDHIHARLNIFINGVRTVIPADVGTNTGTHSQTPGQGVLMTPVHTHDASGKLHIEPSLATIPLPGNRLAKLGDFFDGWRIHGGNAGINPNAIFNSTNILGNQADANHVIRMFVNGVANTEFENYVFRDHDEITILYDTIQPGTAGTAPTFLPLDSYYQNVKLVGSSLQYGSSNRIDMLGGSPLYLPLVGYDPNGGPITYTVTSSNPQITTYVPQNNRTMRINVAGWGTMSFQLFEDKASRATNRVIELANAGVYNGLTFHRVINQFMLQGGDPAGDGTGGSTLPDFDDQFHVDLQHNRSGLLSFAKSGDDTNNSQFFITDVDTRHLDFNHTIFGMLLQGDYLRDEMNAVPVGSGDKPLSNLVMESVQIVQDTTNNTLMLKAPEGFSGTSTITVTARDAQGNQTVRTFTVNVTPDTVDAQPFLPDFNNNITTPYLTPVTGQLTSVDADFSSANPPTYGAAPAPPSGGWSFEANTANGQWTFTPSSGYAGIFSQIVGVRSSSSDWDMEEILFTVQAPGQATIGQGYTVDVQTPEELLTNKPSGFQYSLSGAPAGMAINSSTGAISWTPGSNQGGTHNFEVRATNTANDDSRPNRTMQFSVTVPGGVTVPSAVDMAAASDSGTSSTDNITNVAQPQFVVSGVVAGAVVRLYDGNTVVGQATASGTTVTITPTAALSTGSRNITATQQQTGGQESAKSGALTITIDTEMPADFTATPTGSAISGRGYIFDMGSTDEGQAGNTYSLLNAPTGMAITQTTGLITWVPTTAQNGNHTFTVRLTDAAGNVRTRSVTISVAAQTVAQMPDFHLTDVNPNSTTHNQSVSPRDELGNVSAWYFIHSDCTYCSAQFGYLNTMYGELQSSHPQLGIRISAINEVGHEAANGTASTGRVSPLLQDVNTDGLPGSDVWTSWNAAWRDVFILDAANRPFAKLNVTQTNLANAENYNAVKQMLLAAATVASTPSPTGLDLLAASDTGASDSDNITQRNNSLPAQALQFRVSGVQSGALVKLYYNNNLVGQGTATGSTIDITTNGTATIADGAMNFTATQEVAGEVSAPSAALSVTIDTLAPASITPAFPSTGTVGTAISYDAGNAEEGQTNFRYSLVSPPAGMTINQTTGAITWTPTSAQGGTHSFTIQASDAAGNLRTLAATINVAGGAPAAVDLVAATDSGISTTDNLTNLTTPQFSVSGVTAGAVVKLYNGNTLIGQATASGTTVSVTVSSALAQGTHSISATQTISGVESAKSTALAVTIDTTNPGFFVSTPSGQATVGVAYSFDMQNGEEGQAGFRYSLVSPPTGMTIHETTGVISWTPTAAQGGTHNYQVRATDAAGNMRTVTAAIAVAGAGTPAPSGVDLIAASDSGFSSTDNLTNNTQPQFVISGVTNGATVRVYDGTTLLGTVVAGGTTVNFTPNAPLSQGVHNISASQVVSGTESGKTTMLAVTIDTTAPAAITPTPPATAMVGVALSFNAQNAEEGQTGFRYALVGAPVGATIDEATGVVTWTPTAAQAGARSFDIRATDAAGNTQNLNVALTVLGALPGVADTFAATEDTVLNVDAANGVLKNDGDGQSGTLTATLLTNVAHGTLTLNANGSFSYTPASNYFGSDSFTYQASDGTRTSGPVTVTINVASVNDAPNAVNDSFAASAGVALTINAANGVLKNDTDVDDTSYTAQLVQGPTNGTLTLNADGSFTYTATAGFSGNDTFTYRVNDGDTNSNTATVTIAVNAAPVGVADAYQINEDLVLNVNAAAGVLSNDTDATAMTAELVTGPTHGTLTLNPNGSFTYTPTGNYSSSDSFTYRARDAELASSPVTVTLTVNAVNDAPTAGANQYRVDIGAVLTVNVATGLLQNDTDIENSPLTAVVATQPAHGALVLNADGSFSYTPATGFSGTDTFTYRANDGSDSSAPATVTITVNGGPAVVNDTYAATEDLPLTVMVSNGVLKNDTDAEGDSMTAALVDGPAHGTVTLNADGSFTYTPATDFSGTDTFTYRASDGSVTSALATVTINVAGANDAPTAGGDSFAVDEDLALVVNATNGVLKNDHDMENSPLSAVLVSQPSHGTITLNADGSFTYTPSLNYHGSDTFTYRALDGSLASGVATVTITVRPIADAPAISPIGNRSMFSGGTVVVDVNASDIDGTNATMTYAIVNGPTGATIDPATGVVSWTAPQDASGRQTFTVRATKGTSDALSSTIAFNVDVSPIGGLVADAIEESRRVLAIPVGSIPNRPLRGTTPERPRNGGSLPGGGNGTLSVPRSALSRIQSGGRAPQSSGSGLQEDQSNTNSAPENVLPAGGSNESGGGGGTASRTSNGTETSFNPVAAPSSDQAIAAIDNSAGERLVSQFVREMAAEERQRTAKDSAKRSHDSRTEVVSRERYRFSGKDLASLAYTVAESTGRPAKVVLHPAHESVAAPQLVEATPPVEPEAAPPSDLRKALAAATVAATAFAPMLVTDVRRRRRDPFVVRRSRK